ncbi:MAG: tetratricopeptide repeat protein [Candidatus Eiseniibacteriota bacterium]
MRKASIERRLHPQPAIVSARSCVGFLLAFGIALVCALPAAADAMKDGKDALAGGRTDDAIAAFRTAVAETPNDAQAHLHLGLALERKRSWQAALLEFQKASELDPRLADPYRGQGSVLLRLDRPAEAEAAFRKATDIDRKFPEAQLGLGEALVREKKIPEAIAVLEQGVKFGTKTAPQFYEGLGKAEAARDSLRAAEVWLLKAREAAPNNAAIYRSLGNLYMQRKIPTLAITNYQQAKTLDPSDLDTRMALGDAYYRGQLYNDALGEYKDVVEADPDYIEGYLKLGNLYYLASAADPQRVFQSIETLEKALAKDPNNLEAKALLAQAYFKKGGVEGRAKASSLLNEIEATGTFPPEAWRIRGIIQYESKEYRNALASFAKAPKLEPIDQFRVADSFRRLAAETPDSLAKMPLWQSADSVYARIVEGDSTSADGKKAQFERGRVAWFRKDYAGGVAQLDRAIALDPTNGEAYYYKGLCLRQMGDDEGAIAAMKKAVELSPKRGDWWLQLGATYDKAKRDDEAVAAFRTAAEVDTVGTTRAIALQQLGYKELVKKNYGPAIESLDESARLDPKQLMTWVWLGQANQNAGNKSRAIECYRKALEIKPGEPNATKGLKMLQG